MAKRIRRTHISIIINILIFICAFAGLVLACIFAKRDGYTHWLTKFLYFTQLSNIWIGLTSLTAAIALSRSHCPASHIARISIFKYIFTVSITITGIVFCTLLAPFADFEVWTLASILSHVVVPALSLTDFFTNELIAPPAFKHTFSALIPPAAYFVFAGILGALNVDFGRGDPFPYFFMDFHSEVGLFGFGYQDNGLPQFGTFYWLIFLLLFIYGLGWVFYKLIHLAKRKKQQADN